MSARSEWSLAAPRKLTVDGPVTTLQVRIVGGTVNIVGTDTGPARLELSEIDGPPLTVTHEDGTLTVAYDDLPWEGLLRWLDGEEQNAKGWSIKDWGIKDWARWGRDRTSWRRTAHITLAVPTGTAASVGVIGAGAVVSGLGGSTELRGVCGDFTLVGLTGAVRAHTVSGHVEAQAVTGELRFQSVSGGLTVVDSAGPAVHADSISGDMVLDLAPATKDTDLRLATVSGEIAVRLPHRADTRIEANTTSGDFSCAFDDLRVGGQWGAKRITGTLGAGSGRLKATTVSGAIALLRRPASDDGETGAGPEGKPSGDAPEGRPFGEAVGDSEGKVL
ncbi:DUF4097 family beta strand repeat-containing protein [Streptomyces sp. P1-3]|uniref:DUF4097 family beta strand repeat-containing protein n=1 Tax=Streptomyces sp. P1-3 TaxID=3421658 RepID=UPI003D35EDCA